MEQINNFRKSLEFVLAKEGGYVNDPKDPGGETNYGIAKRFHPDLDIKNLTPEQAAQIYASEYWDRAGCDSLPFPVCTAVFDSSVNVGVSRAVSWIRGSSNVYEFLNRRRMYYYDVVNKKPDQVRFLKGWLSRTDDLRKFVDINSSTVVDPQVWGSLG